VRNVTDKRVHLSQAPIQDESGTIVGIRSFLLQPRQHDQLPSASPRKSSGPTFALFDRDAASVKRYVAVLGFPG